MQAWGPTQTHSAFLEYPFLFFSVGDLVASADSSSGFFRTSELLVHISVSICKAQIMCNLYAA